MPAVTSDLAAARAEHQGALAAFTRSAGAVSDEAWNRPMAPGKWTPGQVVDHVRAVYAVVTGELEGGKGIRIRSGTLMRTLLRATVLRLILGRGRIPVRVRAPRELKPGDGPFARAELLPRLQAAGSEFEARLASRWDEPGTVLTHHIFGRLGPPAAFRFISVHNEHHRRQLDELLAHRS